MNKLVLVIILFFPFITNAEECKTKSFDSSIDSFFKHEDTQFQLIQFPFSMSSLIDGAYEPEKVTTILEKKSFIRIKKIINFQYKRALKRGSKKHIKKKSKSSIELSFSGPDGGYLIYYYFIKTEGCWKLAGFFNSST